MFNLNFALWIYRNLPTFMRPVEWLQWYYALTKPIVELYLEFKQYRSDILLKLNYNGQTIVLKRLLNTKFPNPGDGIFIVNSANTQNNVYLYQRGEVQAPTGLYKRSENKPLYVFGKADYAVAYDFIVMVPNALVYDDVAMRALIDYYKLASKRYIIKTY